MKKYKRASGRAQVKEYICCEGGNVPGTLQVEMGQFKSCSTSQPLHKGNFRWTEKRHSILLCCRFGGSSHMNRWLEYALWNHQWWRRVPEWSVENHDPWPVEKSPPSWQHSLVSLMEVTQNTGWEWKGVSPFCSLCMTTNHSVLIARTDRLDHLQVLTLK